MKSCFAAFFLLVGLSSAFAQSKGDSYSFKNQCLTLHATQGNVQVQAYTPTVLRVCYAPLSTVDSSVVVVARPVQTRVKLKDLGAYLRFSTDSLTLLIDKQSLKIQYFLRKDTQALVQSNAQKNTLQFSLDPQEALYGTGSRAINLNRRGYQLENFHQPHYGYSWGEQNLNVSIPVVISSKGYGIYFDAPAAGNFDLGKSKADVWSYTSEREYSSYFIMSGNNDQLVDSYTYLTGKQPLPPRWALGFIQSRFGYKSAAETIETTQKTIDAGYPIDATVLDLYWYGDVKTMGNHQWRRDSFPEPEKMLQTLHKMGVKTIPITQTFVTKLSDNFSKATSANLFTKNAQGEDFMIDDFWAGSAGLLDIFKPQTQHYLWDFYRQRIREGVAGWWCDLGEPEKHPAEMLHSIGKARDVHSIYPLAWAKTIFEGYQKDFPQQRVFNLARSGGAGMQRYATFPWSGDVFRSWSGYKAQIPIMLGMSMSGIGYMHADAGGFAQGEKDAELYIRWMQFAAFTPIYRAHADPAVAAPEPVFWDEATQAIVKQYVKLRYQLLPYTYSLAYQNTQTGRPLALPLNYFEPTNEQLANVNDAYLWGENMLVAPVLEKGKTNRMVHFPKGTWVNWWTGRAYADSALVEAAIDRLPIFVKKGSFIPLSGVPLQNTEAYTGQELSIRYVAHESQTATFQLYEDDGKNPKALADGAYELLLFKGIPTKKGHYLVLSGGKVGTRRTLRIERISSEGKSHWTSLVYSGGKKRFLLN